MNAPDNGLRWVSGFAHRISNAEAPRSRSRVGGSDVYSFGKKIPSLACDVSKLYRPISFAFANRLSRLDGLLLAGHPQASARSRLGRWSWQERLEFGEGESGDDENLVPLAPVCFATLKGCMRLPDRRPHRLNLRRWILHPGTGVDAFDDAIADSRAFRIGCRVVLAFRVDFKISRFGLPRFAEVWRGL